MSMFFFRLHNLQRAEENKRKKRVEQQRQQQRQRRGAKVFKCVSDSTGHLTLAPSRLFERTPMSPSDSLDEIALQIPRLSALTAGAMVGVWYAQNFPCENPSDVGDKDKAKDKAKSADKGKEKEKGKDDGQNKGKEKGKE
ncbi:GM20535 [Drosophila sechellia]|uniref:GM20535 n=1 Tax=Drosophila sechellia TaxID=7238 RepID=B4HMN3_DROSE|nr:GM20535 [Drosophila sechellia]